MRRLQWRCWTTLRALINDDDKVIKDILGYLPQIIKAINQLPATQTTGTGPTKAQLVKFAKKWAAAMVAHLDAWTEYHETIEKVEVKQEEKHFRYPTEDDTAFQTKPYRSFAANRAKKLTIQEVAYAEKNGLDIPLRLQKLPLGCITIADIWRQDVNAVVESILQVNFHPLFLLCVYGSTLRGAGSFCALREHTCFRGAIERSLYAAVMEMIQLTRGNEAYNWLEHQRYKSLELCL